VTSNAPEPVPPGLPPGDDSDLVEIFLTVAVRTSDGSRHGVHQVPRAEAARLIAARHAVAGGNPPRGWTCQLSRRLRWRSAATS
jgi:hypothetical protein